MVETRQSGKASGDVSRPRQPHTTELKRDLLNILGAVARGHPPADGLSDIAIRLSTGSPEVIEAMARAQCFVGCREIRSAPCPDCDGWQDCARTMSAALAAGMKKVMESGHGE